MALTKLKIFSFYFLIFYFPIFPRFIVLFSHVLFSHVIFSHFLISLFLFSIPIFYSYFLFPFSISIFYFHFLFPFSAPIPILYSHFHPHFLFLPSYSSHSLVSASLRLRSTFVSFPLLLTFYFPSSIVPSSLFLSPQIPYCSAFYDAHTSFPFVFSYFSPQFWFNPHAMLALPTSSLLHLATLPHATLCSPFATIITTTASLCRMHTHAEIFPINPPVFPVFPLNSHSFLSCAFPSFLLLSFWLLLPLTQPTINQSYCSFGFLACRPKRSKKKIRFYPLILPTLLLASLTQVCPLYTSIFPPA